MKKINIEDYLHALDKQLQEKTKKDLYMIYIMIFAGLFAFSYLLFWDLSLHSFESKVTEIKQLKQKIHNDEIFLRYNTPALIASIDKKIKAKQEELMRYKDYNQYIKSKIEAISFLLYDESVWGEYINSVDKKAKRFGVQILELTNKYNDTGESFGHVLDITLTTKGRYKNVLKFVNALEQSDLVVDIHDINISAGNFLRSDLNISVWGIKY